MQPMAEKSKSSQPAVFISHGSPMLALEDGAWRAAIRAWGAGLEGLKAVVVVSAHWETTDGFRVSTSPRPGVMHDFAGFPEDLYRLGYQAPGDPVLAVRVLERLREAGLPAEPEAEHPLDHGAWVPLRTFLPAATIPIVQVSLPRSRTPELLAKAGAALAPLRAEGVLLLGSGGLVHNLRQLVWDGHPAPAPWARTFEAWMMTAIREGDTDRLMRAAREAPGYAQAAPTPEHLDPVYFALGAANGSSPSSIYEGWQHGNLSLRAVAWA